MDLLKNQFQRIQQQLSGLTATQKMLTGALVAIMVMTLLYWGRYAGTADMEPLFEQTISPSDLGNVQNRLALKGVKTTTGSGGQIMVPADKKMEILADLAYSKALPRSVESGFEQMLVKLSPWASATERDAVYNRAKEITCSKLISYFPDVEDAQVMIDPTKKREIGISGGGIEPSATVNITMNDGTGETKRRQVADAAASVIVGSQAGMKTDRIKVIVNGKAVRLSGGGSADSAVAGINGDSEDLFNRRVLVEQIMEKSIAELFAIPGLRVKVAAKINNSFVASEQDKVDPKSVVVKPVKEETRTSESGVGSAPQEPGAIPNVGEANANGPLEIGASAAAGAGGTRETTERNENIVLQSREKISTRTGAGEATVTSASVRVPHSHFVDAYRSWKRLTAGTQPEEQALQDFIQSELTRIRDDVRASAGMNPDAVVSVNDYFDVVAPEGSIAAVPQAATMSIPVTIGKYGKEIALSGLALVSLFMVSMMVKKSAPAPIAITTPTISGPTPLMVGEAVAGEATAGGSMLDGMELDEDAIKTEQMLDQVSTLVKENPDGAASLVKRWLNRD